MKVNWKVRFKNKVWLGCFFAAIVSFAFTMLALFDIFPSVTEDQVMRVINAVLMLLSMTGVIVDPTTSGVNDSERAMGYDEPWVDKDEDQSEE